MRVQERPDELPADIFEAEFKMRVLVNGVVAAEEGRRADHHALLFGDFFRIDQSGRIARARRRDRGIEWMREMIPQSDARRGGFDLDPGGESG